MTRRLLDALAGFSLGVAMAAAVLLGAVPVLVVVLTASAMLAAVVAAAAVRRRCAGRAARRALTVAHRDALHDHLAAALAANSRPAVVVVALVGRWDERALIPIAARLRRLVRPNDRVVAQGGGRFGLIVPAGAAGELAGRVAAALQAPVPLGDDTVAVEAVLGAAAAVTGRESAADLLAAAEPAGAGLALPRPRVAR